KLALVDVQFDVNQGLWLDRLESAVQHLWSRVAVGGFWSTLPASRDDQLGAQSLTDPEVQGALRAMHPARTVQWCAMHVLDAPSLRFMEEVVRDLREARGIEWAFLERRIAGKDALQTSWLQAAAALLRVTAQGPAHGAAAKRVRLIAHACARVLVDAISDDDTTRATRLAEEAGAALAYNHITSLLLNTCDDAAMPLDEPEVRRGCLALLEVLKTGRDLVAPVASAQAALADLSQARG
ncbi:hypothetical protein, partial [Neoaquamicrobium sediminum]|uniref:hypothetical protein n=1 Tax=Neoaquamicrobium sediminum TaxID=1849104 RepID=UPI004035A382